MREQEVGIGVTSLPSLKKGMVAPVETQNRGAEVSGCLWLGGRATRGAWLKALGDMLTVWPRGSCWEWLLVGMASLV